jgi:hypothetical protein
LIIFWHIILAQEICLPLGVPSRVSGSEQATSTHPKAFLSNSDKSMAFALTNNSLGE